MFEHLTYNRERQSRDLKKSKRPEVLEVESKGPEKPDHIEEIASTPSKVQRQEVNID